jgi:hypothetical protein
MRAEFRTASKSAVTFPFVTRRLGTGFGSSADADKLSTEGVTSPSVSAPQRPPVWPNGDR